MFNFVIVGALLLVSKPLFAFVENVTHGYVSCLACHVSPSGGGLLNDYGRSLSNELMSTWTWEGSEDPLFGAIKNTENLKFGGDARAIQTYFENSQLRQGKLFGMQRNVELGLNVGQFWFVGTAGTQGGPEGTPNDGQFLSERHYVLWSMSDEIKLRAGKFRLQFGINDPTHTRLTKAPLGFGSNSESYILEFSKFSEADEFFVSADFGRVDLPPNRVAEKSVSLGYSKYISENAKVTGNLLAGESDSRTRYLIGMNGVLAPIKKTFLIFELDGQQSSIKGSSQSAKNLVASSVIFGIEASKGVLPYGVGEYLHSDLNDDSTEQSALGAGLKWFPIPHIEFQAEYKKQTNKSLAASNSDAGWVMFHFYL
ncbi:MAG: hypothetical protein JNM39_06280 [Bdellovibrionaceae bacterium]|nr:hypothetical protein [Pseudobdellovibrionaceae bacterium]